MIVAVFAEPDSPLIGLRNLVMPMRASNIHYNDLLHVVIIGDVNYLKSKFNLDSNVFIFMEKFVKSQSFVYICTQ